MGFFDGGFGGAVSGILGAVGGLAGGYMTNQFNSKEAAKDRAFQKEVYQNQLQWKAADAKKAGLHPLAVIGSGSYSASPSSVPSVDFSSSLGKLGEGIGDAFTAYMNKDEIAEKAAKAEAKQDLKDLAEGRLLDAQTEYYSSLAMESAKRAMSYTIPMASGREILGGQVNASPPYMDKLNKYAWPIYPDGSHGDPIPSSELSEAYENAPGIFAYTPYIDAAFDKWRSILTGKPLDGRYHDWRTNRWTLKRPPRNPFRFWD